MFLRNLMAMDTEEMIRAQPMDAVVLIGGCDKTVPAQLMGAASAGVPAIQLITGSMLTGSHRGEVRGRLHRLPPLLGQFRAGEIDEAEIDEVNNQLVASVGTCGDGHGQHHGLHRRGAGHDAAGLGVAAGRDGRPHPRGRAHRRAGGADGARPAHAIDRILTPAAFTTRCACCWPSAAAPTASCTSRPLPAAWGWPSTWQALDRMGRDTPVLLDLKPSGPALHGDFHAAGGMATLLRELKPLLKLDALTVTGRTLGEELEACAGPGFAQDVVRRSRRPDLPRRAASRCCSGNLAPGGAIIKQSAAARR
jgi:dihydroxy-acid dehydratase